MANRRKVTVIDDEPSVLRATERLLRAKGFEVETFASAEAFLACGATRPTTCLVLDIKLGGMSGIELRRRLKASNPNLPVIFITAFPERLLTGERAEPTFLVTKPYNPDMLKALISQALFFNETSSAGEALSA